MVTFMQKYIDSEPFQVFSIIFFTALMMLVESISAVIVFVTLFFLEVLRWKTANFFMFPKTQQNKFYATIIVMLVLSIFI